MVAKDDLSELLTTMAYFYIVYILYTESGVNRENTLSFTCSGMEYTAQSSRIVMSTGVTRRQRKGGSHEPICLPVWLLDDEDVAWGSYSINITSTLWVTMDVAPLTKRMLGWKFCRRSRPQSESSIEKIHS